MAFWRCYYAGSLSIDASVYLTWPPLETADAAARLALRLVKIDGRQEAALLGVQRRGLTGLCLGGLSNCDISRR